LFTISCIERQEKGFYFADNLDKIKNFDVYFFSKDDLIRNIGYPNIELVDGTWLYYSYVTENLKVLKPKLKKEYVLLVSFGEDGDIKKYFYKEIDDAGSLDNVKTEKEKDKKGFFRSLMEGVVFTAGE
jgi:hypothetical protein